MGPTNGEATGRCPASSAALQSRVRGTPCMYKVKEEAVGCAGMRFRPRPFWCRRFSCACRVLCDQEACVALHALELHGVLSSCAVLHVRCWPEACLPVCAQVHASRYRWSAWVLYIFLVQRCQGNWVAGYQAYGSRGVEWHFSSCRGLLMHVQLKDQQKGILWFARLHYPMVEPVCKTGREKRGKNDNAPKNESLLRVSCQVLEVTCP